MVRTARRPVIRPFLKVLGPALQIFLPFLLSTPAWPLEFRQDGMRGLEDHSARLLASHSVAQGKDSLRLEVKAEWRAGFRAYNRDSRRLFEQTLLDGTHRLDGPWRLRWKARQSLFNERRSLRETLGQSLEAGIRHAGFVEAEVLAGWMQDRRQSGQDQGLRVGASLGMAGTSGTLRLDGRGSAVLEEPGDRRNQRQEAVVNAHWKGPEETRNSTRLALRRSREDAFPDPLVEKLERRGSLDLEVENLYQGRLAKGALMSARVQAWSRRQDRDPRDEEDSSATHASYLDRGLELQLEPFLSAGAWRLKGGLLFLRQAQETQAGTMTAAGGSRSAIARQRLHAQLLWLPGSDSLGLFSATELRRRDTDFMGLLPRDPDDMDQARREGLLRWSHVLGTGARLSLECGLQLSAERHVQASRSQANHQGRTWRAAAGHRMRLGAWLLAGSGQVVADYRLYDFDSADEPRSWIQRRLQVQEKARRELALPRSRWRWTLETRGRWMEEDGGSYLKADGLERLSDSAREWQTGVSLEARRGSWALTPGWDWLDRRDWDWSAASGQRRSTLVRWQRRQGPLLQVHRATATGSLHLDLKWEWVGERLSSSPRPRRNLWARLEWSWRP
jgi:hypothetical protein